MINKKASEHMQEVMRMIFVSILVIFLIVTIYRLMSDIDAQNEYKTRNLEHNSIMSKILNSADCYAYEYEYTFNENSRTQVHASVIDKSKLLDGRLNTCLDSGQGKFSLTFIGSNDPQFSDSTSCSKSIGTKKMLVSVRDGEQYKKGLAEIEVCI